jgi:hypothetical protein
MYWLRTQKVPWESEILLILSFLNWCIYYVHNLRPCPSRWKVPDNRYVYFLLPELVTKKSCPTTCHQGTWGERKCSSYSFFTSALNGGEWSASRPGRALAHCAGGWVGPRVGQDTEARKKILSPLPRIEPRSPGRPARSQMLY